MTPSVVFCCCRYTYVTTVSGCFVWTVIFLYTRLYTPVRGVLAHDRLNSQPKRLASLDTGINVITTTISVFYVYDNVLNIQEQNSNISTATEN